MFAGLGDDASTGDPGLDESVVLWEWSRAAVLSVRVVSNSVDKKLGSPHFHSALSLVGGLYTVEHMLRQSTWNHVEQSSHMIPFLILDHVTALEHTPQGNFGCLGPGLH